MEKLKNVQRITESGGTSKMGKPKKKATQIKKENLVYSERDPEHEDSADPEQSASLSHKRKNPESNPHQPKQQPHQQTSQGL